MTPLVKQKGLLFGERLIIQMMYSQAFIFDFDGVIVNSERFWEKTKKEIFLNLYGVNIAAKLSHTLGKSIKTIDELAQKLGSQTPFPKVKKAYDDYAEQIYRQAPITDGLEELISELIIRKYSLGIVSASPRKWMDILFKRVNWLKNVTVIISIFDRDDLDPKPAPDGYLEAMKLLSVTPERTIVLEDSQSGIDSAKATGAFTIGFKQYLQNSYTLHGADMNINRLDELDLKFIKDSLKNLYG